MKSNNEFSAIYRYIESLPVFSDHEHHGVDADYKDYNLDKSFQKAYVAWTGYSPDGSVESRKRLLQHVRFNSYFEWFEKGVQKVHDIDERLTLENWDIVSQKISEKYSSDPDFHWRSLRDNGYECLIQDSFWNPGSNEGHPDVFKSAYRVDKFMWGFHPESHDPDNFYAWKHYGFEKGTLEDWVDLMNFSITSAYEKCEIVCLKCAEAYNREISFLPDDYSAAKKAFGIHPSLLNQDMRLLFGNYIINRACELAGKLGIPFQIHTGLGNLCGSQPMLLQSLIWRYPEVKFVLFHSGYPWIHEVAGLAHNFKNVFPNLTWTATISTAAAVRALHEFIDVSSSINHITWGSDSFNSEDSVGALMAWRFVVAKVISERYEDGRLTSGDAEWLARKLMYGNGRYVYLGKDDEL